MWENSLAMNGTRLQRASTSCVRPVSCSGDGWMLSKGGVLPQQGRLPRIDRQSYVAAQDRTSSPPLPVRGSLAGNGSCRIRSTPAASGAERQISQCWPAGYAPTTRNPGSACTRKCPVPTGSANTSPASTVTTSPFSPPSISCALPPAKPRAS